MKSKSITYKLIGTFTLIIATILLQVGIVLSVGVTKNYKEEKIALLNKQFMLVQDATISLLNQNRESANQELTDVMKAVKTTVDMDCIIVDNLGYVYQVSDENEDIEKYSRINISDEKLTSLKKDDFESIEFTNDKGQINTAYVKAVYNKDYFSGAILFIGNSDYLSSSNRVHWIIWGSILLALILPICIAYYFTDKLLLKPLAEINNAAKKLAKGEVERRVSINSDDEIGELAESFNIMAESLQKVDITRREFISNVSHELRSPITSIKGFITGILDGVIPKDKENYYLNIVNDEVGRLSRLVNDLLDISAMEAGKFNLNMSTLDVNEVITLCILNLEGKIKNKNMSVEVVFNDKHEYGIADRDRLIQIVTNVLENAIKYGKENGEIKIETYSRGEKIYVSIFNNGPNIPKADINNIWDRFYKSDKSRTNKVSTGLGLPIVRLILSQHGQDIWVKNIEGKGVEFTFTLKKDK